MRKLGAAGVVLLGWGCSSTTNVTNVYVGEDASADSSSDAADSHIGTAPVDAGGDAQTDAADDSARAAAAAPMYQCTRTSDCSSGICCASVVSGDAAATACLDVTSCTGVFANGSGSPACGSASDSPTALPV